MTRGPLLIFVLGMHRSGTSVLTRVISLAGAELPANLMTAREDNATGFWEPVKAVNLTDAFLASLRLAWDSLDDLPQGWSETPQSDAFVERAAALLRDEY